MLSSLGNQTVSDLIISLLQAETAAQTLYLRLMEAFAHEPEAAEVWWKLGADEAAHIRLLEQILDSLPPPKNFRPPPIPSGWNKRERLLVSPPNGHWPASAHWRTLTRKLMP